MSVGEMFVGEMSIGEVSVGEMSVGEMSGYRLSLRYSMIHCLHCPLIPTFSSFIHKITQLNAFDRSRNIAILYSPLFLYSYTLFAILFTARIVYLPFLNPFWCIKNSLLLSIYL